MVTLIILISVTLQEAVAIKDLKISLTNLPTYHGKDSLLLCVNSTFDQIPKSIIICSDGVPLMNLGYCATYDNETNLMSITKIPYHQLSGYNISSLRVRLPQNLSQLNDYMCGPLHRKGALCSECVDGFGPSVTSFKYKCVNCNHSWYGVPLFLFLKVVPLTIFYLSSLHLESG